MLIVELILTFFSFSCTIYLTDAFTVYWNSPTQQCLRNYGHDFTYLLRTYGILVNDEDKFQGDRITIFYESQLGLYPRILSNGTFENGGLPQLGNLSIHLEAATQDIKKVIPNKKFDGVGVIDWESWRPTWKFNWAPLKIYQEKSKALVKQKFPNLDNKEIEELAKSQWEKSAKLYMLETLLLVKKLRPLAKWGFYLFPDCYNYAESQDLMPSDFECSKNVKTGNDRLSWLWKSSTSIHPSVYLNENHLNRYTIEQRSWKDNGKLKEAMRVAPVNSQILPYVNYFLTNKFVPQEDFQRIVGQIAAIGGDGLIIWGSSASVSTRKLCDGLKDYIIQTLGPTIERVSWNSKSCSNRVCNGNGLCTWPNDLSVTEWKLFLTDKPNFNAGDIVCKCKPKYSGRFCEKSF